MGNLKFTLIVCTYLRPEAVRRLLYSIKQQQLYPDQILIIDGSKNTDTEKVVAQAAMEKVEYFRVEERDRGLTRQRNFGIDKVLDSSDIVSFLDDDTQLYPEYFKNIIRAFEKNHDAIGIGGVAKNENRWRVLPVGKRLNKMKYYEYDGHYIKESSRNIMRNYLGLNSSEPPGVMPAYSHGRTYAYPLNNKLYRVDLLIGMAMSFRKSVFEKIRFSPYFEGYGLYEDADFCIRALNYGNNYLLTSAVLDHFHEPSGRPNIMKYGKMVIRNGWYVWRLKYPKPSITNRFKWNAISFLLTLVRYSNAITGPARKQALSEAWGRTTGWFSLLFNKPKLK